MRTFNSIEMINDYNGPGDWSLDGVRRRYSEAADRLGQDHIRDLCPRETSQGNTQWIYPVMNKVIVGMKEGDGACIEIAVQFVESGHQQAFGRILHANAARALRRAPLTPPQVHRLRQRLYRMLVEGQVPHEFHEYAKLLRKIGLDNEWSGARARVDETNQYVMRYVRYLERHAATGA